MKEKTNPFLTYPVAATPGSGEVVQVLPGIYWLRLPIPFELKHINVWLLEDGDAYTLVDTGISSGKTCQAWEQVFKNVLNDKPIRRIIVTHFHPDHFGLARWLCERSGASYYASEETLAHTNFLLTTENEENADTRAAFYQQHGIEDAILFEDFLKGKLYAEVVSGNPESGNIVVDKEIINIGGIDWRVIMTYGHASGHITLYSEALNVLISGDQILPSITSNISVFAEQPEANPLDEYLQSFDEFKPLPDDTMVLPSHGKVFSGIHMRIGEIIGHHHTMLDKVHSLCEQAHSAKQLVPKLFSRKLDGMNSILAFGETIAHLNYLCKQEKLQRVLKEGCYVYQH